MEALALVEETQAQGIHGDAVAVIVAVHGIAAPVIAHRRLEGRRAGVDGGLMGALPMAGDLGAKADDHVEHLAGVVLGTAHLQEIGVVPQIARAHFRIRLETAGAGDGRAGAEIVFAVLVENPQAVDAARVAVNGGDPGLEADIDAEPGGDLAPSFQLPLAAAQGLDHAARLEMMAAIDGGVFLGDPLDAGLERPMGGGIGFPAQCRGQVAVDQPLGHPVEVAQEFLLGVRLDLHRLEFLPIHVGYEVADLVPALVAETEPGMGKPGVAAIFGLGRLFDHDHLFGARLARRNRRLEGGAAAADDDDVTTLVFRH